MDGLHLRLVAYEVQAARAQDWQAVRGLAAEQRHTSELIARLRGDLDGNAVHVDARRQTLVLGKLSDDDPRSLAAAAREGRLEEAANRVGLPEAAALSGEPAEEAEWQPAR